MLCQLAETHQICWVTDGVFLESICYPAIFETLTSSEFQKGNRSRPIENNPPTRKASVTLCQLRGFPVKTGGTRPAFAHGVSAPLRGLVRRKVNICGHQSLLLQVSAPLRGLVKRKGWYASPREFRRVQVSVPLRGLVW